MTNSVTLLGVKGGPSVRPGSHLPTATLVSLAGKTILVDAGLGVSRSLCDAGVDLTRIDAVFITHMHSDHYLELGPLFHTAWTTGRTAPYPVLGPKALAPYWTHFCAAMDADVAMRIEDEGREDFAPLMALAPLSDGMTHQVGDVAVKVLKVDHPPIDEAYALRFDAPGASVVLSGDTAYFPPMVEFARGADLLVHEAMLTDGVDAVIARNANGDERLRQHILRSHTSAQDVGRIATDAAIGRLAINHLVPDGLPGFGRPQWEAAIRETWTGPFDIGHDGLRIEL